MSEDTQQDALTRYVEELLYEALDVMRQLKADAPVGASWISRRNILQEEAKTFFESAETEAQRLLQKALNLMGQLKADAPVSTDWITEGESLRNQAQAFFLSGDK